ncbi:MAG: RsmE family RNA methyltransferase, partial [Chitinivibrionales bacterium]
MNMILLHESEIRSEVVSLQDFRAYHIIRVLRAEPGRVLKTGVLNRGMGTGTVTEIEGDRVTLKLDISSPPPPPAEAVLICALPRPKIFKKVLYYAASMGIKEMHFINSWRVEKSFWKSPVFKPEKVRQITNEALAQSCDTIPPETSFHRFFSEFAEKHMPEITAEKEKVVCHPYA